MDPDTARVAMLHQDPHPAHRGFAEAVGADLLDYHRLSLGPLEGTVAEDGLNGLAYPNYDVYLVEGSRPLYVGKFGTPLVRAVGRRGIDGVIAVSEFAEEFTRPVVGPDTPIEIAHPFVQQEAYDALGEVEPDLDSNVAVTVARPWEYKGVDMLVEAWPRVREQFPDAQLHVVGKGHPDDYGTTPGVRVRGYVEDLADAFAPASLFVQPSRMDTFPVSTLEAMRAGLPPLVTRTAGTRSEAREIDPLFVAEPNPEALARGVREYFVRDRDERRRLSTAARERGSRFDPESRKAAFREAFRDVLKEL